MNNLDDTKKWSKGKIRRVLGLVLWIGGMLYTVRSHFNGCPPAVILGGWLLAPPIWMIVEYHFLFNGQEEDWDRFKHMQSLERNLWLGMAAFLAALYLPLN